MPTIALIVEKSAEIVCIDELEKEKESEKELKIEFDFSKQVSCKTLNFKKITSKIISKCKFKHEMISSKIFIPPPELV